MKSPIAFLCLCVSMVFLPASSQYRTNFASNYAYVGAGYGMASIKHIGLTAAVGQFNQYYHTYYQIQPDIEVPSQFTGPAINVGIVNTQNPTDWMFTVSLGIYNSHNQGVIHNYISSGTTESFELKNNLFIFSLGMLYMPLSLEKLDAGIGMGLSFYQYEILSKTGDQAYYKHDDFFSFGINFTSCINLFPLGKNRMLLLSFQPYYHVNLASSVFDDIYTIRSQNEEGDIKGFFSHAGIQITINQPYRF